MTMLISTDTIARRQRAIRTWLLCVAAVVFALVIVGGATRLTESGLSIVEWKPVTGVLPPLTHDAWQDEFDKYKMIPQYAQLNAGMSLDDFKTIYWWEWTHRLLGRVVGLVFLLPFLWFLWRGWIEPGLRAPLWGIFGLGALQGAVGWWMVSSGLAGRVEVSQYRLATHLVLACLIFAAVLWCARLIGAQPGERPARIRIAALALLALVLLQIYLGAIVAGLRAGLAYNTWPLIDGALVPDAQHLLFETPLWRNVFENPLTAQFDHRMLAYVIWIGAVLHAIDAARDPGDRASRSAMMLAVAVTLQAALGIATLLFRAPLDLALLHQAMAMAVLALATVHAASLQPRAEARSVFAARPERRSL